MIPCLKRWWDRGLQKYYDLFCSSWEVLSSKGIDICWRQNPVAAEEIRQALGFIVEAATSQEPLSRQRQLALIDPFYFDERGEVVPEKYRREGIIASTAVMTARAFGLAEGQAFGDLLSGPSQPSNSDAGG